MPRKRAVFRILDRGMERVRHTIAAPLAEAVATLAVNEVKLSMEEADPRTGRVYLVPGTQTPYTASAPGEPPAIREGRYRDSWKGTPAVVRPDGAHAVAYSDLTTEDGEYLIGDLLEHGTQDLVNYRVRMEPRPHIRPALPEIQRKATALARRAR